MLTIQFIPLVNVRVIQLDKFSLNAIIETPDHWLFSIACRIEDLAMSKQKLEGGVDAEKIAFADFLFSHFGEFSIMWE